LLVNSLNVIAGILAILKISFEDLIKSLGNVKSFEDLTESLGNVI